ncbi:signal peptidase I [Marinobacter fonticola]|uniref:signal peptidase I n=1 Tax=Marinobacter fonticola TaxID=2603215 RepID=UPI0011E82A2F|nr:signal peptidase I [Marinobacter fonticola]
MDIDFPLILVTLTFATGLIWLGDRLFLRARREARFSESSSAAAGMPSEAAEEKDEPKEPYLVDLSRSFFPVLAIVLVLRSFLVEPFQIPSGSMLPTLEVGDFILVNKFAYGLRLPVAGTKVVEIGDPQRGDVMVFKYPKDGQTNYIKRVIGLPGDTVTYRDHTLFINGEEVPTDFVATLPPVQLFEENLGDVTHQILKNLGGSAPGGEGQWTIPEHKYFVMGDNRDNSNDSRYWGTVPDELVVGKAFAIWMHLEDWIPSFGRVGLIE